MKNRNWIPEPSFMPPARVYNTDDQPLVKCSSCYAEIKEQTTFKLCKRCSQKALKNFVWWLLNEATEEERKYIDFCIEGVGIVNPENIIPL